MGGDFDGKLFLVVGSVGLFTRAQAKWTVLVVSRAAILLVIPVWVRCRVAETYQLGGSLMVNSWDRMHNFEVSPTLEHFFGRWCTARSFFHEPGDGTLVSLDEPTWLRLGRDACEFVGLSTPPVAFETRNVRLPFGFPKKYPTLGTDPRKDPRQTQEP